MPMFNTTAIVILQETVESDMHGRIFAIVSMIASGIMPLSMVVFGPLADFMKIETIIIITNVVFLIVPIVMMFDKKFRGYKVVSKLEN